MIVGSPVWGEGSLVVVGEVVSFGYVSSGGMGMPMLMVFHDDGKPGMSELHVVQASVTCPTPADCQYVTTAFPPAVNLPTLHLFRRFR